jgi:hypothetical protein
MSEDKVFAKIQNYIHESCGEDDQALGALEFTGFVQGLS